MGHNENNTVYCDIQMPLAQGRKLLELMNALRGSQTHPISIMFFEHMQDELGTAIDIV